MTFQLDPNLETDGIFVIDFPLCHVRLENVRNFPWLVLTPRIANLTEIHQLSSKQQTQLMHESKQCALALLAMFELDKINVGSLGNVVSQLHWHVVGRRHNDDAWPSPVWGYSTTKPYTDDEAQDIVQRLRDYLHKLS